MSKKIGFIYKPHFSYIRFYKPFGVMSQFSQELEGQITLKDFLEIDKDTYPIGRLDKDSEGLLLLSNDPAYNQYMLHPSQRKEKEYYVQVEGQINESAIRQLCEGVSYRTKGKSHFSKAVSAKLLNTPEFPNRNPPIRYRKNVPDSWASITINEGKNRQVRKMMAATGYPVLRLVRIRIDTITLEDLTIGEYKEITFLT